jgi:regulatory protein
LSDGALQEIEAYETVVQTKLKAMRLLAYRERSEHELRKRLREKQCPETAVDEVLRECKRTGLIDDCRFAEAFVNTRMIQKPSAKRMLLSDLRAKGVNPVIAETAVNKCFEERSEEDVARELVQRKARRMSGDSVTRRKRLGDFLARRGFGWDIIRSLLNELNHSD